MKYLALTIGPIYKTLSSAKKTRDLWGGSYLFSYIMKQIILKLKDTREFIVPYTGDEMFKSQTEVGLFHDRFIFQVKDEDSEEMLLTLAYKVVQDLEQNMNIKKDFLKNYLQIHVKMLDVSENPILELTPYLDTKELFFKVAQYDNNLLQEKLQGDNRYLKKEAFGENRSFSSLPEIALCDIISDDIRAKINSDNELSIYEDNEVKKILKPYHKYIAIVHADGDNMGKVVNKLNIDSDFKDFSKNLFDYCFASHNMIKEYGGETIFAGGDDLLFFAPVVNDKRTIFDLIADISKEFDGLFEEANKKIVSTGKQATLSFGISITYYKYPLYEALERSRNLLFTEAKQEGKKNNIAFTIIKHSGQSFGGILPKTNRDNFEKFLNLTSNISYGKDSSNFLHSLHHKIYTFKTIFNKVADDEVKLKNFFDNYFTKNEHEQYREFFDALSEFILEVYGDNDITNKLELIYAILRFVKFIKGDKS